MTDFVPSLLKMSASSQFTGTLRGELLNREVFDILAEAKILIESWRKDYNETRLHSALGY